MLRYCTILVLGLLAAAPLEAISIPVTTSGTFVYDTDKYTVDFTLAQNSTVTIRTMGYGGGTAYNGTVYAGGGFESVVSIFETASGNLVNWAQSSTPFVGCTLDNGICGDVFLQQALTAGSYTVVLTQWDNIPSGSTLADGFLWEVLGGANFNYTTRGGTPFLARDEWTQRTGDYALEITRAAYPTVVPEPTTYFGLAGGALVVLRVWRRRRKDTER